MIYGLCFCSHSGAKCWFWIHFCANWNQNGAKSEPKGNQHASKNLDRKKAQTRLTIYHHCGATWSILGTIVTSGRPPTPLDAGTWGQPLFSMVLVQSGGDLSKEDLGGAKNLHKWKHVTRGYQKGIESELKVIQNATLDIFGRPCGSESASSFFERFKAQLGRSLVHFGAHWILNWRGGKSDHFLKKYR